MITLYSMPSSGNSYKVRLLLAQLGIAFRHVATEWDHGREITVQPEFRHKNPAGKVPMVEFEDGTTLAESNAILHYFGEGTPLVPEDRLARARMYQWMFFEQNSHETSIAVRSAQFVYAHKQGQASTETMAALLDAGNRALDVMEAHLSSREFMAGDVYSLADIALYAYSHSAPKGGFDIGARKALSRWLERVREQPGHVPLEWLPER